MLRDLTSRIFIALLALSLIFIWGYRLGWMESQFDGLSSIVSYGATGTRQTERLDDNGEDPFSVRCSVEPDGKPGSCGLAFILSYDKSTGFDFSNYNRVEMEVKFTRPLGHERLRFYLKNYNERYAVVSDSSSFKYNSVEFSPTSDYQEISIPFDYFQVATWWISKRSISFEDAQFDVRNVPVMEFSTGIISTPGEYLISVKKLMFYGERMSEFTLYKILFIAWVMAAIFILNKHRILLQKTSREDSLTGTLNRRGLNYWFDDHFDTSQKNIVIFYIDIDDFKRINDNFGHAVGDALIQGFCKNINTAIQQIYFDLNGKLLHTFSRLSGDEFVVVFKGMSLVDVDRVGSRLLQHISELINIEGRNIKINASIGVAINDDAAKTPEALISNGDVAMYSSKRRGKNQVRLFDASLFQKIKNQKLISEGLRKALDLGLFRTVYMPIYATKSRELVGVEVLLRCTSEDLLGVSQDVYIPIAEEYGLIAEIDLWVIEQAFKDIATVPEAERLSYSINISSRELHSQTFIGELQVLLSEYNILSKHILFEITETSLIDADSQSINFLRHLRNLGFRLALDDFGTGYTAFNQLMEYPVQYLKIDKTFIDKIGIIPDARTSMVDAIIAIARSNHLEVVAEGVETEAQIHYMTELGCDFLQGYYLSKPLAWQDLNKLLETRSIIIDQD